MKKFRKIAIYGKGGIDITPNDLKRMMVFLKNLKDFSKKELQLEPSNAN